MKTIHIEICKSEYAEGKYRIRIGDINKKDFSQDSLNKFANMKTLIDTKS